MCNLSRIYPCQPVVYLSLSISIEIAISLIVFMIAMPASTCLV